MSLIFLFLLKEGLPAFWETSLGNLFGKRWYPNEGLYGTLPLLMGSLLVTAGAVVIAVPLGLATAVFIRELAPDWLREILKPLIEVLADKEFFVSVTAQKALKVITRHDFGLRDNMTRAEVQRLVEAGKAWWAENKPK